MLCDPRPEVSKLFWVGAQGFQFLPAFAGFVVSCECVCVCMQWVKETRVACKHSDALPGLRFGTQTGARE